MSHEIRFERYVALGDSSTEGIDDPDGNGGFRGWSRRLAERIAAVQGSLLYSNLAIRGRLTRQIRDEQLEPAVAMRPDLATVFAGSNDVIERRFDAKAIADDVAEMQRRLVDGGATVLTFTLPDLTPLMPMGRMIAPRVRALNQALRDASARTGARLIDFAAHAVASDPRLWSEDRFHANSAGHARIAAALGHALGLPGADDSWARPLPTAPPQGRGERFAADLRWGGRYMTAWAWQRLRRRPFGHDRQAQAPRLERVLPRDEG